jgi:hypothetical protein
MALSVIATEPTGVMNAISNLTGGLMEIICSYKAVIFATTKTATLLASSVLAGLAANGLTPHLHQNALLGVFFEVVQVICKDA